MKEILFKILPPFFIQKLRRLKLSYELSKPYVPLPFALSDIPKGDLNSTYPLETEKMSAPFQKVMRKLESYVGAGPVGPNKYWEYPWVLAGLNLVPGLKILDAGCGRAPLQYLLSELGMQVSAIDPNENAGWHGIDRRLARKYGLAIDYRVEGMEKISYPDETFDRVMSVSVIEHCRATPAANDMTSPQTAGDRALQARMMGEMARVLKKGGLLVVTLDIMFPECGAVLEINLDVKNLIECPGLTLLSAVPAVGFYGYPGFDMDKLARMPGLDIQDYSGVRGTSLGLVFRKQENG